MDKSLNSKTIPESLVASVMHSALLFDSFERNVIIKYSGKWGFQCPDYAPSIIIRYNMMKIKREFVRFLKLEKIVSFVARHCA